MNQRDAIQALIDEMYALISGPGDQPRDWSRQAELFMPQAQMIRTVVDENGVAGPEILGVSEYPASFERKIAGRSFHEIEIRNVIEVFGNIAHAFSTYEAYEDAERTRFIKRGINSIQLYKVDGEWKIAHMVWDDERDGLAIDACDRGPASDGS